MPRLMPIALATTSAIAALAGQAAGATVVARPSGQDTVVEVRDGEGVRHRVVLAGRWVRPVAAPGDRRRGQDAGGGVVLARRATAGRSEFVSLGPALAERRRIVLRGRFDYDAVSPDGTRLYLIERAAGGNPDHYAVRLYDVAKGRLEPYPVADKREVDEPMTGAPVWRTTDPDGRWAYTLYARAQGRPFIHALETSTAVAVCIDLPWPQIEPQTVRGLRMALSGSRRRIAVLDAQRRPVASVAVAPTFRGYPDFVVTSAEPADRVAAARRP